MRPSALALSLALHLALSGGFLLPMLFHSAASNSAADNAEEGRLKRVARLVWAAEKRTTSMVAVEGPTKGATIELPEIGNGTRREFEPASFRNIFVAARHWGAELRASDYPVALPGVFSVLFCNPGRFDELQGRYALGQFVIYDFPVTLRDLMDREALAVAKSRGLRGGLKVIRAAFNATSWPYFAITEVHVQEVSRDGCSENYERGVGVE